MDGNLAAKVAQEGPGGPKMARKGLPNIDHRIYPMIAALFWGHVGAILGADLGVSWGALGLDV